MRVSEKGKRILKQFQLTLSVQILKSFCFNLPSTICNTNYYLNAFPLVLIQAHWGERCGIREANLENVHHFTPRQNRIFTQK